MSMSSTIKSVAPFAQIQMTIAAWIAELATSYNASKLERNTRAELLALTDIELADIGLTRAQAKTMDLSQPK